MKTILAIMTLLLAGCAGGEYQVSEYHDTGYVPYYEPYPVYQPVPIVTQQYNFSVRRGRKHWHRY